MLSNVKEIVDILFRRKLMVYIFPKYIDNNVNYENNNFEKIRTPGFLRILQNENCYKQLRSSIEDWLIV